MILEIVESILPYWMVAAPRRHFASLMAGFAGLLDALGQNVIDARMAQFPGQVNLAGFAGSGGFDSTDALDLTGRDRSIRDGLNVDIFAYAAAQRDWLNAWGRSATVPELLDQVARILGPNPPMLRFIERGGTWWTRYAVPDVPNGIIDAGTIDQLTQAGDGFRYDPVTGVVGAIPVVPHLWDWDSLSNPPLYDDYKALGWLVIYADYDPFLDDTDHTFNDPGTCGDFAANPGVSGAGFGPDAGTIGINAPRRLVDLFRNLETEWRTMGAHVDMIVSFDPDAFNPNLDSTPTSIPDGRQGWHSWYDAALHQRVPHRFPNAEYLSGHHPISNT